MTVDFTQPEGQRIVRELAAKADILLENFKVGGLKAYGLDYESLKQVNPKLIYCSITGFGQSGPYAKRAGYDFMIQGLGGLMSLTGRADNEEGAGPVKVGVALTDILTGLYSSTAVLAALAHRDVSGIGQHIDMALLDVQVACLANQTLNYLTTGVPPRRLGNAHEHRAVPGLPHRRRRHDPHGRQRQPVPQVRRAGRPPGMGRRPALRHQQGAGGQPRGADPADPPGHGAAHHRRVDSFLERAGVPGPINDLAQVFADPQVQARGLRVELPHPLAGTVPQVASPIRLSETPVEYRNPPPTLGQHPTRSSRRSRPGRGRAGKTARRQGDLSPRAAQRRIGGQRPTVPRSTT